MSTLAADVTFDFSYPPCCEPATPPTVPATYPYDPSLLELPYLTAPPSAAAGHGHGHARSSSTCSAYSAYSFASAVSSTAPSEPSFLSTPAVQTTPSTRTTTPARSPPVHTHGPLLLPKIRSQDQSLDGETMDVPTTTSSGSIKDYNKPKAKRSKTTPLSTPPPSTQRRGRPPQHARYASVSSGGRASVGPMSRHVRSFTNPDPIMFRGLAEEQKQQQQQQQQQQQHQTPPPSVFEATPPPPTLLCSPVSFVSQPQQTQQQTLHRRASSTSVDVVDNGQYSHPHQQQQPNPMVKYDYGFSPYPGTLPTYVTAASQAVAAVTQSDEAYLYQPQLPREPSPLSVESVSSASASGTPEPMLPCPSTVSTVPAVSTVSTVSTGPQSTLLKYLTSPNPAPALVRSVSFPIRDARTKHFWWDVRQVRPWSAFTAKGLIGLPGAASVLTSAVPTSLLPMPTASSRQLQPETEMALASLGDSCYVPRLNAALALSSPRPVQLSVTGDVFVGTVSGDGASAAALFGGRTTARVVGIVKAFDRFNTGMRASGNNIKRVEYLKGLAHLQHVMREHSCRYGFVMTEIELVVVRAGTEETPFFGHLEVASVPLARSESAPQLESTSQLTAGLALWGLCMLASDELAAAAEAMPQDRRLLCPHKTHIGAPAEGTRRKAAPRDGWMPPVQLAEKRMAKRARGWVMPEDPVGRKEMGRRGVRYNGI